MNSFQKITTYFLNLIFPPRCVFCGQIMPPHTDFLVCSQCEDNLPYASGHLCKICGTHIDMVYGNNICYECRHTKRYFDRAVAPFFYEGLVKNAIIKFKFSGAAANKKVFSKYMIEMIREFDKIDCILFTPISGKRHRQRGYNQSELLAEDIIKQLSEIPMYNILRKIKETKPQSKLPKKDRRNNVKDAYIVTGSEKIKDKQVLLIDDVLTTGSTVNECAKVLKKSGAKKVYVLTLATSKATFKK